MVEYIDNWGFVDNDNEMSNSAEMESVWLAPVYHKYALAIPGNFENVYIRAERSAALSRLPKNTYKKEATLVNLCNQLEQLLSCAYNMVHFT